MFKNKKILIMTVIISVIILLCVVLLLFKSSATKTPDQETGNVVKALKLTKNSYHPIAPITVTAKAHQQTTVSAKVSSTVWQIDFKAGQAVKQDQLLIQLDPEIFQIDVVRQQANVDLIEADLESNMAQCQLDKETLAHDKALYELAQSNYQRQESLQKNKYASESQLDAAREKLVAAERALAQKRFDVTNCDIVTKRLEAQLDQSKADLRLARKHLNDTEVYPPYPGIITEKFVSLGRQVSIGQKLFTIYDPNSIELEGVLTDQQYHQIQGNIEDVMACDSKSVSQTCFKLDRLSKHLSSLGTGHIAYFTGGDQLFNQGQTETLYMRLPEVTAYAVPAAALYHQNKIFLIKQGRLQSKSIHPLGKWSNEQGQLYVLIDPASVQADQLVMVSYLPGARSGLHVDYQPKKAADDE